MYLLITVSGLTRLLRNFSSQQLINPSNNAIAVFVYAYTVALKSLFAFCDAMPTIFIQCPGGENFFVANITWPCTFILNGLSSQKLAICFCSSVKLSPIFFTSIALLKKSPVLSFMSYFGGRPARQAFAESSINGLISIQCDSTAEAYIGGVGTQCPSSSVTVYLLADRVCA